MKTTLFTVFALGGWFATTIANPMAFGNSVEKRQDEPDYTELNDSLTALLADIQTQTGAINATLDTVPDGAPDADVTAGATAIATQLSAITDLFDAANSRLAVPAKRDLSARYVGKEDLFKTVSLIIFEVLFTAKKIIFKLGLGKVLIYLTPTVLSLKGLLYSLDKVVAGLLLDVTLTANELLKAVGLGLIGVVP
ncbi:hypothetical protein F5Y18DRAFT_435894 [Xylariaceae sp. FL1019]|nr:hypothetical protein F5Y18DRAFT_435894 [Xylariaceae sp. FL1019]